VLVPERIDVRRRHEKEPGIQQVHAEKAPIPKLGIVGDLFAPAFFIDYLSFDG